MGNILGDIAWAFDDNEFIDENEFSQEVKKYQEEIMGTSKNWIPDKIVIEEPQIYLQYEAWIQIQDELLENEELYDDDAFDEDNEEDGYFQVEIISLLKADNKKGFTMLELLMKIQNQLRFRDLGDHIFFEGIEKLDEKHNGIPIYYLYCGS